MRALLALVNTRNRDKSPCWAEEQILTELAHLFANVLFLFPTTRKRRQSVFTRARARLRLYELHERSLSDYFWSRSRGRACT